MTKFTKGVSGNPAGKKPGTLSKRSQLVRLLEPHAEKLVMKAVDLALNGDANCLRLCMERLIPKAKSESISIVFPDIDSARNAPIKIYHEFIKLLAGNEITLEQAKLLTDILKHTREPSEVEEGISEMQVLLREFKREY